MGRFKPSIVGGTSGGALIMMPALLGKYDELYKATRALTPRNMFSRPFLNDKGNPTWWLFYVILQNIIGPYFGFFRKNGFSDMKPVAKTLRKLVDPYEFRWLCKRYDMYVGVANLATRTERAVYLNNMEYDEAIDHIIASSSIPVATVSPFEPLLPLYDGGVLSHIVSHLVLKQYPFRIDRVVSIYSIPEEQPDDVPLKDGLLARAYRAYEMAMHHSSANDQREELEHCQAEDIELWRSYVKLHTTSLYDTDDRNLESLYEASKSAEFKQIT